MPTFASVRPPEKVDVTAARMVVTATRMEIRTDRSMHASPACIRTHAVQVSDTYYLSVALAPFVAVHD